jgi:hypothetical protein|tara:strand:- start:34 stop:228 length:195 start_codon:yes stop_codon:yes gene_type:complete
MEKINENGLEIFKGEKLIIVIGKWSRQELFYDFVDGLLKKGYTIIEMVITKSDDNLCALQTPKS